MLALAIYKNRLRVRVAGILERNGKILLLNIHSPILNTMIWIPPGGGVQFGESLHGALKREFFEETNLKVEPETLCHVNELIEGEYHAIEFFFRVNEAGGEMKMGHDPEISSTDQIIKEIGFFGREELKEMAVAPQYLKKDYWQES